MAEGPSHYVVFQRKDDHAELRRLGPMSHGRAHLVRDSYIQKRVLGYDPETEEMIIIDNPEWDFENERERTDLAGKG